LVNSQFFSILEEVVEVVGKIHKQSPITL